MSVVYYVYAVLLLVGGIIGYSAAKSTASLAAGVVSALLAAIAAHLSGSHHRTADGIGLVVSFALTVVFFMRYQKTKKFMPSLLMCLISVVVLIMSGVDIAGRLHS